MTQPPGPSLAEYTEEIDEQRAQWLLAKRLEFVAKIEGEIGSQQKGSVQVFGYWRSDFGPEMTDEEVWEYSRTKSWCGGLVLWGLHEVGVATDVHWVDGEGFALRCKLPIITIPKPGDIAYWNVPYRHYATVASVNPLVTIDGNQLEGVTRKTFPKLPPFGDQKKGQCVFFSIEPLLLKALDG